MSEAATSGGAEGVGGAIGAFVRSGVAGNLLMVLALGAGVLAALNLPVKAWPDVDPRQVVVTVPYPGSSPAEVEESITRRIEERVIGLDGVRRVTSRASSEVGTVTVDVEPLAVTGDVLEEVRSAVEGIEHFPPPDADSPEVAIPSGQSRVVRVAVASPGSTRLRCAAPPRRCGRICLRCRRCRPWPWNGPRTARSRST